MILNDVHVEHRPHFLEYNLETAEILVWKQKMCRTRRDLSLQRLYPFVFFFFCLSVLNVTTDYLHMECKYVLTNSAII